CRPRRGRGCRGSGRELQRLSHSRERDLPLVLAQVQKPRGGHGKSSARRQLPALRVRLRDDPGPDPRAGHARGEDAGAGGRPRAPLIARPPPSASVMLAEVSGASNVAVTVVVMATPVAFGSGWTLTTLGAGQPEVKPGSADLSRPCPQLWRTRPSKLTLSVSL